jgi:hypothetical protein
MENKNKLIEKTNKSYMKHFGLKIRKGFVFKDDLCILELDGDNQEIQLLNFLKGLSCVLDNLNFWGIKNE